MANSSSTNLLTNNTTYLNTATSSVFYSSKLINYVEPIEIAGYQKTVFYSELNTNFNIGDRVFILDGNYNSNDYITQDKYTKYTDGYRVLGVDGCRIILDLDYTGVSPYQVVNQDNVVNVYHISDQRQFDYINSIKIGLSNDGIFSKFYGTYSSVSNKTILYTNNIIFAATAFSPSNFIQNKNQGVYGANFYIANSNTSNIAWQQINLDDTINSNVTNGSLRIYIIGEDIIFNNLILKQRNVYKYQNGTWVIDTSYKQPIISKLNFRHGRFSGKHNDGVFGTNLIENNWNSATWNSGIFVNSNWNSGIMNSKSVVGNKSYYSKLGTLDGTTQSIPVQTIDYSNNKGFGYNIVIDSNIYTGNIVDGNFENCNIGLSSTYSSVDIYYGLTASYGLNVNKGQYKLCDINSVMANYSTVINCEIHNSIFATSKLVNSQIYDTVADKSEFNADSGIKVISADLWSYTIGGTPVPLSATSSIRGVIKLFISNDDLVKINVGDSFYVSKINKGYVLSSLTNDQKVLLPIETKYLFDSYFDSELSSDLITVSIKSKSDNKYSSFVTNSLGTFSTITSINSINLPSIDIESNIFGWYHVNGSNQYFNFITKDNVNGLFQDTYLHDADFKSGLFINSTWVSGDNKNYNRNIIGTSSTPGYLNIQQYGTMSQLNVGVFNSPMNPNHDIVGQDIFKNDNVWLTSIENITEGSIYGRYRVDDIYYVTPSYVLESVDGFSFSSFNFSIIGATGANYVSISRFLISNSTIKSGTFKRTAIRNSIMENTLFDNTDTTLSPTNNDILKLTNIIFTDNNNTVNSGLINQSHFINEYWNNGIIYNSIWNGSTFNNGVFNSGYWVNGTFSGGIFLNSKNTKKTSVPFDNVKWIRTWLGGNFNAGQFSKSTWLNGTFNNGRFSESDWYGGIWNNGILGSSTIAYNNTTMGYYLPISGGATFTIWNNGIVDNALIGGSGSVYWYGGKFNGGEFTSFGKISSNESIWYGGDFNGGKVTGLSRWKNGNFNAGKFLSYYGYKNVSPTNSSTFSTDYGWENGRFNGGEFGNASTGTNSVWYNGEFNGGVFTGRFWNYGIFTKGSFIGSGTWNLYNSPNSSVGEFNFANSFTQSYFGLWNDGWVVDVVHNVKLSERVITTLVRKIDEKREDNTVNISNMLWLSGTFSHKTATLQSSLWLNGQFVDGTFDSSIFNGYVDRDFTGSYSNSSFSTQSIWYNGRFNSTYGNGSFYNSEWKAGTFNSGYMSGAAWRGGVWNYGTAENIYWENGLWRNGNWNGSPFDYTSISTASVPYTMISGRDKDVLLNISNIIGTGSMHLINAFSQSTPQEVLTDIPILTLNGSTSSWWWQPETYSIDLDLIGQSPIIYPCSTWSISATYGVSHTYSDSNAYTTGGTIPKPTNSSGSTTGYNNDWNDFGTYFHHNIQQNCYYYYGISDPAPSSKLYAWTGTTTSVFTQVSSTYVVNLQLSVELADSVSIEFMIGGTYSTMTLLSATYATTTSVKNNYPKIYNVNFVYPTTTDSLNLSGGKEFYIRKTSGGILRVLKGEIKLVNSTYHPIYNNVLYNAISGNNINFPNDSHFGILESSDSGDLVSINFGNGVFKSGIWENGVWNNGYRSLSWFNQPDYYLMSDVIGIGGIDQISNKNTYQLDNSTWTLSIKALSSLGGISVGDKVAIGNIVAIDVNEKRKIITDYYRVIEVDIINNILVVKVITNFPIRRFEKDSSNHLIYVTKNVWLSGAFLNGYFVGVWNNGLMKGFPNITEMQDTQWLTGKLDGGHFISSNIPTNTQNQIPSYNTGLVQNFTFIDNNIAPVGQSLYESWMDVNYFTSSYSHLNKDATVYEEYKPYMLVSTASYISNFPNLKGYPTADVMQSISYFRDSYNLDINPYILGTKYNRYGNLIPNDGNFNLPFSSINNNIGIDNFTEVGGWTFSNYYNGFQYESNIDLGSSKKLKIYGTKSTFVSLNNLNITDNVSPNRYYMSDLDISSIQNIDKIQISDPYYGSINHIDLGSNLIELNNHVIEYFYNTQELNLWIGSTIFVTQSIYFNNISFYELDMIPFFQYATSSGIDMNIKTPYQGVAPYIDYNNPNFDFIGNVQLTVDSQGVVKRNSSFTQIGSIRNSIAALSSQQLQTYNLSFQVVAQNSGGSQ